MRMEEREEEKKDLWDVIIDEETIGIVGHAFAALPVLELVLRNLEECVFCQRKKPEKHAPDCFVLEVHELVEKILSTYLWKQVRYR